MVSDDKLVPNQASSGPKDEPQGLCILGSTGSIGTQTLDLARLFPERLKVRTLTAGRNAALLAAQAREFAPEFVVLQDESRYLDLKKALSGTTVGIRCGEEGLAEAVTHASVGTVVTAVVGFAGLKPTLAAIRAGKKIALANKETLVVAGALVMEALGRHNVPLIPVDSEHSAIFQCLVGEPLQTIETLILTASGGPFRQRPIETFSSITLAEALRHPNWAMGAKITIDSATMMNKGLEVIEAHWLFDIAPGHIEVLVHPQSIVHSMVTFQDGSTKAQLGVPDMKVPIQYALSYPDRWAAPHERISWSELRNLDFELPDFNKFPCLRLAFEALEFEGTAPCVLNAANEQAVALFLQGKLSFLGIPQCIEACMEQLASRTALPVEGLVGLDTRARQMVMELSRAGIH